MRSYLPAIVLSVFFHLALVLLVVWGWEFSETKPVIKPPSHMRATLVELETKTTKKLKVEPAQKKIERVEQRRKQEELKQKQQKQKQAKKDAENRAKKKAQELRKNQLAKEKAAKEKAQKAEQEALRKIEQKKKEQQQRAEALKKKALADELAKEKERLQAKEDEAVTQSYIDLITARVEQNWSRPPSARNGMQVQLRIQLVPTGHVISVNVIKSSGNSAFDRSAIRAIKKIERFSELKDVPSGVFERNFRNFIFSFNPQDLRQ